jgi:hypothetical protein
MVVAGTMTARPLEGKARFMFDFVTGSLIYTMVNTSASLRDISRLLIISGGSEQNAEGSGAFRMYRSRRAGSARRALGLIRRRV